MTVFHSGSCSDDQAPQEESLHLGLAVGAQPVTSTIKHSRGGISITACQKTSALIFLWWDEEELWKGRSLWEAELKVQSSNNNYSHVWKWSLTEIIRQRSFFFLQISGLGIIPCSCMSVVFKSITSHKQYLQWQIDLYLKYFFSLQPSWLWASLQGQTPKHWVNSFCRSSRSSDTEHGLLQPKSSLSWQSPWKPRLHTREIFQRLKTVQTK